MLFSFIKISMISRLSPIFSRTFFHTLKTQGKQGMALSSTSLSLPASNTKSITFMTHYNMAKLSKK